MSGIIKNERGTITISNSVLAKMAGYAASKCYGVVGMAAQVCSTGKMLTVG